MMGEDELILNKNLPLISLKAPSINPFRSQCFLSLPLKTLENRKLL